jgi:hydrogenase expression/formation protein HypC
MCLAIPMQIQSIDGLTARCEAKGVQRDVSLFMLQDDPPLVGEYVKVSLGNAIEKVSEQDARLAWELFDQILAEIGGGGG